MHKVELLCQGGVCCEHVCSGAHCYDYEYGITLHFMNSYKLCTYSVFLLWASEVYVNINFVIFVKNKVPNISTPLFL
jgi:hypothetical protein